MLGLDYEGGRLALNDRLKKWITLGVLMPVVIIIYAIALFVLPQTQRNIVVGLMALVIGSITLFGGIKQHRAAKEKGVSLPWWKFSPIIGSLLQYCLAGMFLSTGLATIMGQDGIGIILGTPFALLTVGLSIYCLVNRTSKQLPTDFQQLPPTMQ
jgi:hypothetical protein